MKNSCPNAKPQLAALHPPKSNPVPHFYKPKKRPGRRGPARSGPIEVIFSLETPSAREVYLYGDFNNWSPAGVQMTRRGGEGCWERRLTLAPGRYEYRFLVDGAWIHDRHASEQVPNVHGTYNSVVVVRE